VSDTLTVQSHRGPYTVRFEDRSLAMLNAAVPGNAHFIIDERVARLYQDEIGSVLEARSVLLVDATEQHKSLEQFPRYVEHLVSRSVRRNHVLVAIGGGIIQDITCFLAATMLRGLDWNFYPTTLLAQADSCIGSKSSINCGQAKNVLGTFTPPRSVHISTRVLRTLDPRDVRSGVGEMLKVHAIDGPASFDRIATDYRRLFDDPSVMMHYIRQSLEIKRRFIEVDEFDQGIRNVMNYGHTFGHAIEAATNFAVPHGIAVTIGMDMANFIAVGLERAPRQVFERMHPILRSNYEGFEHTEVPFESFQGALARDKKNTDTQFSLILPDGDGKIGRTLQTGDAAFWEICGDYLTGERGR
jgi:3-dehydroquinate synthase